MSEQELLDKLDILIEFFEEFNSIMSSNGQTIGCSKAA